MIIVILVKLSLLEPLEQLFPLDECQWLELPPILGEPKPLDQVFQLLFPLFGFAWFGLLCAEHANRLVTLGNLWQ